MASQLTLYRLFPVQINFTKKVATRLNKKQSGIDPYGLAGLSAAEVSERFAAIQDGMDSLAKILRLFLIGLVLLGVLIVSATPGYSQSRARPTTETSLQMLHIVRLM